MHDLDEYIQAQLLLSALSITTALLREGGTFVAKVLAGGAEGDLQKLLKQRFTKVVNVKPPASRVSRDGALYKICTHLFSLIDPSFFQRGQPTQLSLEFY